MKKKRLAGFVSILLVTGAACSDTPAPAPPPPVSWDEPRNYRFVVDSSCGERSFIGRFLIRVEDREIAAVKGLDDSARATLTLLPMTQVPTLGDLLREADEARERDADVVEVELDDADGHPSSIEVDANRRAIDDEFCYEITRYEPGKL